MKSKSREAYLNVLKLNAEGKRICDIVRITGIGRSCVNNWINRKQKPKFVTAIEIPSNPIDFLRYLNNNIDDSLRNSTYSFILGMYLGDGCIARNTRTKQLTIALDKKYNILNEYVIESFNILFGRQALVIDRSVDRGQKTRSNSIDVRYSSINIGLIFPHEGVGAKHLRHIELAEWQKEIIDPVSIVKGLIYSDGSYFYSRSNKTYNYTFVNTSIDIINILEYYLKKLGIVYNKHTKHSLGAKGTAYKIHLNVNRKLDVIKLHGMIGDKTEIVR